MNNMRLSDSDQWRTWTEIRTRHIRKEKRWRLLANAFLVLCVAGAIVLWLAAWSLR